jgi:hypothetical protein
MSSTNLGPAITANGPTATPTGNVQLEALLSVVLSPSIVATITTAEQTFTVTGLIVGDFVSVAKPTAQAGLGIAGARVSAANTLAITFVNPTAAGITPTASEAYVISVRRPLASALQGGLPSSLPLP